MTERGAEQVAPKPAGRGDVQRLVAAGAQLVLNRPFLLVEGA